MPQGGPVGLFSSSVFSGHGIFEESQNFAFWGDLRGAFDQARPHVRACLSRETGPFLAFPLFPAQPLSCLDGGKDTAGVSPALDSVRRVKRFTPDACRAVATPRNATNCVEAQRRDLTFPQSRAIV